MESIEQKWQDIDVSTQKGLRALDQFISKRTGGTGNCVNCFYTTDVNQALDLVGEHYFALNQNPQTENPKILWGSANWLTRQMGQGQYGCASDMPSVFELLR